MSKFIRTADALGMLETMISRYFTIGNSLCRIVFDSLTFLCRIHVSDTLTLVCRIHVLGISVACVESMYLILKFGA